MHFIFPRKLVVFDNYTRKMTLLVFKIADEDGELPGNYEDGRKSLDALAGHGSFSSHLDTTGKLFVRTMESNTTKEEFEEMVSRAKEYIVAGDIIQVVLSQRFSLETNSR